MVTRFFFILDCLDFKNSKYFSRNKSVYVGKGIESLILALNAISYLVLIFVSNFVAFSISFLGHAFFEDDLPSDRFLLVDFMIIAVAVFGILGRVFQYIKILNLKKYPVKVKLFCIGFVLLLSHYVHIILLCHWKGRISLVGSSLCLTITLTVIMFSWAKFREIIEENTEAILMQRAFHLSSSIVVTASNGRSEEFSCEKFYPVVLDDGSIWIKRAGGKKFVRKFSPENIKQIKFKR